MRLIIKKIVAREVLLVFVSILLVFLVYLGSLSYNLIQDINKSNLINEIQNLQNSDLKRTSLIKRQKREDFFRYLMKLEGYDYNPIEDREFWLRLEQLSSNDSIEYKWHNALPLEHIEDLKDYGVLSPEDYSQLIESTKMEESELTELDVINRRIAELSSKILQIRKLDYVEIKDLLYCGLIVIILCIFIIRYTYYVLTWSIRTLRN